MIEAWAARHNVSPEAMHELRHLLTPSKVLEDGASESRAQSEIRLASAEHGSLWRNNAGATQPVEGERPVRYGLGNDSKNLWEHWRSGDLVGITSVPVQPHHVGRTFGVFTMIECKHPGWNPKALNQPSNKRERAQMNCLTNVAALGGIAGFACSPDDYVRYIETWKK